MDIQLKNSIDALDLTAFRELFNSLKNMSGENEQIRATIERHLRIKALSYGNTNANFTDVNAFIEFVINLARDDICSKTLTIQLLQDIFDVSTINRCEELFGIVEMHIGIWKTPYFFDSCKNMILRMCNDLLKRLSRTIDTTFCGKILILLAKSLPLNEKSGLNLTGQFNTPNVTLYDFEKEHLDEVQPQIQIDDDMEVGEIRDNKDTSGQIPADHNIYIKFWELQKYFSNPNLLFEVEQFKHFQEGISDVFTIFAVYKLEKPQRQHEHSPSRSKECETIGMNEELKEKEMSVEGGLSDGQAARKIFEPNNYAMKNNRNDAVENNSALTVYSNCNNNKFLLTMERTFFAKYLTSQKLFSLQLADSQFRRYFLLQFLIVSNYLASKIKMKEQYELSTEQENILKDLIDKCYTLLRETYPHGAAFTDSIKKILSREKQWSLWKADNCTDLISQLTVTEDKKFARRKIHRYDPKTTDLGNKELTRLWNIETSNVQACKDRRRKCIPDLKAFLEGVLDEMDPEQQVEEQYQSVNDEKYQWMASRFLLLNSDQYISYVVQESTSKTPEKNLNAVASTLRKTMQLTAENIPELKPRLEQIQTAISKKNAARQAEEARLAARTRELERRIKLEEEEQQVAIANSQIKKEEANDLDAKTAATTSTEIKKEKEEKMELDHQQHKEKNKEKESRRAQTPTKKNTITNDRQERRRSRTTETASSVHGIEKDEVVVPPKKRIKHEEENSPTVKISANAANSNGTNSSLSTARGGNRKEKEKEKEPQQKGRRESKVSRDEKTRRENDRPKNNKRKLPTPDERSQKHENTRKRDP